MSCTELRNVVKDLLKDFTARTHKELDYLSRMELRRPIVQNEEEYDTIKDRIQKQLRKKKCSPTTLLPATGPRSMSFAMCLRILRCLLSAISSMFLWS